jgi:hypothetical protein
MLPEPDNACILLFAEPLPLFQIEGSLRQLFQMIFLLGLIWEIRIVARLLFLLFLLLRLRLFLLFFSSFFFSGCGFL